MISKKYMRPLFLLFLSFGFFHQLSAQLFYKDVAGVFYARCTSCHHQGSNDFPFMNYTQTSGSAATIQAYLNLGIMPPWNADTSYTRFQHERIITASEKQKVLSWIASGALPGDTTQAPPAPVYSSAYQLAGNADLTLGIGTFTSTATSNDMYYCFSIPSGLTQDRIIRAFEIVPGNPAIVHHAVVTADTTGIYNSNLSGFCYNIPGNLGIGTYAPGTRATVFPSQSPLKAGIRLKAGSKIIIQMHHPAGSAGEVDSTKIRLYFYPIGETGIRPIYSETPLQNWNMNILANTSATYSAYYPSPSLGLPIPISAFAVMPHSHLLCKSILMYAVNPGIDTVKLIRINNWDFEWQDYYSFNKLVKIPAGYKLYAKHVFDNTSNNPNNPNNPPINVSAGTGTNDEMLFDGMLFLYYQPGDELIDVKSIIANDPLLATGIKQFGSDANEIKAMAFPNPFTEETEIRYLLNTSSEIKIEIHDLQGRRIAMYLSPEKQVPGMQIWAWDGKNAEAVPVPEGVYVLKLNVNGFSKAFKLMKQ